MRSMGGSNNNQASIIVVEGVDDRQPTQLQNEQQPNRKDDQRSYNTNSAFQIVGVGGLTDDRKQQLTRSEQRKLRDP
jgi:hypothetical protein